MLPEELDNRRPPDYGRRLPAALAAIGLNQLKKLPAFNACRREQAAVWDAWCISRGWTPPTVIQNSEPVFLRYPVLANAEWKERAIRDREFGRRVGVWFQTHLHPVPKEITDCPRATRAVRECINLPTL